jgi:hypothetical protein
MLSGLRKAIGKERAISNAKIVKILKKEGFELSEVRVRKIINYIRIKELIPNLIATSEGYYIATSKGEIEDYIRSLVGREKAIREVRMKLENQLLQLTD